MTELLAHGTVVLDGGLSNALEDRGHDLSSGLWTARLLRDDPGELVAVHRAYFAAGARVATTASYQASVPGLVAAGLSRGEAERLIAASVRLAREARDEAAADTGEPLFVAASVGPYGAVRADGSEYTGHYGRTATQLRDFHGPRLELLAAAGPDLLAVETIPDADEAEVLVPLLEEIGVSAWFSYSVAGGATRAGQPLVSAYEVLKGSTTICAAGVNCSAPADVPAALRTAVAVTGLPGVAYPNSGEAWDNASHTWAGTGAFDPREVRSWIDAGAQLVGGCCRVGADDIAAIADLAASWPADVKDDD
jgi:homocysteine S-methyltransferase